VGFVRRERHLYRRGGGPPSRLRISPGDLRFCWAKTTSMTRPWNSRRSMSSFASCAWSMLVNSTKANGFGRLQPQGVGRGRGGVSAGVEREGQLRREPDGFASVAVQPRIEVRRDVHVLHVPVPLEILPQIPAVCAVADVAHQQRDPVLIAARPLLLPFLPLAPAARGRAVAAATPRRAGVSAARGRAASTARR
jgi:hypothetical protein